MKLSEYPFPKMTQADINFPTTTTTPELVKMAEELKLKKGRDKFNELFFQGGKIELQDDVKGTWKENAYIYARCLMSSFAPKHEHKEAVCAMIFEECLKL